MSWWNSVLDTAQAQLSGILEDATAHARLEIAATAAALAHREKEVSAIEAAHAERQAELDDQTETIEGLERLANERERLSEQHLEQARRAADKARKALSGALARAADLVVETEAVMAEREAEAKGEVQQMIGDATTRADGIVAEAQSNAERSRANLRDVAAAMERFLARDVPPRIGPEIDLRDTTTPSTVEIVPDVETDAAVEGEMVIEAVAVTSVDDDDAAAETEHPVPPVARRSVWSWASARQQAS